MRSCISTSITCGCLAIGLSACSNDLAGRLTAPMVPDSIKTSSNEVLLFSAKATGVQIYECQAKKDDSTRYEWSFKAPEADLFDAKGGKVGRHYAGPTWEASDGSKVVGEVKGHSPAADANAIPWLLLSARQHEGNGIFSHVTSIQRVETSGGKAPAEGCDQSSLGNEVRVPYTAVYYFYVSQP